MTPTVSVTRVTDEVRRRYNDHIERYEALGQRDEVAGLRQALAQLEAEDGHELEVLVCAVCGNQCLKPTRTGRARPHRRESRRMPTWDQVREVTRTIAAMLTELDRMLDQLEPD